MGRGNLQEVELLAQKGVKGNGSRIHTTREKRMVETVLSAVAMILGGFAMGFILGHKRGFYDGFQDAVTNSDEIADMLMKNARMRVFKMENGKMEEVTGETEE